MTLNGLIHEKTTATSLWQQFKCPDWIMSYERVRHLVV